MEGTLRAFLFNFTSILFISISALAYPLIYKGSPVPVFPTTFTDNHDFEGVVALSNCSGALFQFENAPDSDNGLILTNGHCLESGFPRPGTAIYNVNSSRRFWVYNSSDREVGTLNATKVVYGTMTKTDMAVYRLRETYAQIKSQYNVRPFVLSSKSPVVNEPIEILSGYWNRGYACSVEAIVKKLKEGDWISEDSIRFSRPGCDTIPGTSGSPVISAHSRVIVGVNNTGNEDGDECTDDNPCEIDENGKITYQKGWAYGQQTYWVYSCLNANREFDILMPGCVLPH
jgi:V8-like Glu-specific endopeptidase